MNKINLDVLAKELKQVSLRTQKEQVGGASLPTVSVVASYPSWWWGDDGGRDDDWGGSPFDDPLASISNGGSAGGIMPEGHGNDSNEDKIIDQSNGIFQNLKDLLTPGNIEKLSPEVADKLKEVLAIIENSEIKLRIVEIPDNGDLKQNAVMKEFSQSGFVIYIETGSDPWLLGQELYHVYQSINSGEKVYSYTLQDEVDAHQFQHDLQWGKEAGYRDLDGNWVKSGDYRVTEEDVLKFGDGLYDPLNGEASSVSTSSN